MEMRIEVLKAKEKRLNNKLAHMNDLYKNAEDSLHLSEKQVNDLERKIITLTEANYEYKQQNIMHLQELASSIKKEQARGIAEKNERLQEALTATRAAMLTYKNMHDVMANQVKNLKLIQERRKDETDNMIEALREMQSESVDKDCVGKLYFVIMLSRWQEAAVNKKYEAVLSQVKSLRGEVMVQEA